MINPVTRAALALRERRRAPDMAQIMSALPVPVVLLDTDNRFRFVNHAAEQFLGISASGLSQLHLRDRLLPRDEQRAPERGHRSETWFPRTTRCSCWSIRSARATPPFRTTICRSTARG